MTRRRSTRRPFGSDPLRIAAYIAAFAATRRRGMTYSDADGDLGAIEGSRVAVVGYGNQGRSWALNLRDSGLDPLLCVRHDASREQAENDGFAAAELTDANAADVICVLVPDDVIPSLPLNPRAAACTIVAS